MAPKRKLIDPVVIGRLGGAARQRLMTPEQRTRLARKAVNARWRRYREQQKLQQQAQTA